MKEISIEKLQELVEQEKDLSIIDVRTKEQYDNGHIPGAIHIPLSQLENHLDELDKDTHYYTICQRGIKSKEAAEILDKNGYQVTNTEKGMPDYQGELVK